MKKLGLYIFLCFSSNVFSQTGDLVFNDTVMHNIFIETDLPNWFDSLDADYKLNSTIPGHPQKYFKCKITFDGFVLPNCGFKEKGNASNSLINYGKKKPLKLSFDEFANQTLNGLKKINLNNFTNDPSLLHDVICLKLMRDEGIFASRTSFAKLWVNQEFIGLYVIIENVDKTFLKSKYGSSNNDGNLYKTDRNAQVYLNWLGWESSAYKDKKLELNTNETVDDWSKLISFINFLNNDNGPDFKQELEKRFDVHGYLKILAVEKCVKSWDSYWGGGNNYFLYEHPDGKIRWIPWDMNETFQDIKVISGTSLLNGYLVPTPQFDKRPLVARIFEYDDWRNEYLTNVCALVNGNFTLDHLGKYIVDRHDLIDSAYKADPYKYNTYNTFKNSLTDQNEDVVSISKAGYALRIRYPGIFPLIQEQRKWAVEQITAWDQKCSIENKEIYSLNVYPNPATDHVIVKNDHSSFEYAQFKLYDFTGKLCKASPPQLIEGKEFTLELKDLSSGIYWLIKNSADGSSGRTKLVIAN